MTNTARDFRKLFPLAWPGAFLGAGGMAGLWLGSEQGGAHTLAAGAVLVLTAVLGGPWLARARAALRRDAAGTAYAEREIIRARRAAGRKGRVPAIPTGARGLTR